MSSVLQCMALVEPLNQFLASNTFDDELNTMNPLGSEGEVAKGYRNFIRTFQEIQGTVAKFSAFELLEKLAPIAPQFSGTSVDGDPCDFFLLLLDILHEDLKRAAVGKKLGDAGAFELYRPRHDSIISDLFFGDIKTLFTCQGGCDTKAESIEPSLIISLPLPNPSKTQSVSFSELWQLFSTPETLEVEHDGLFCTSCNRSTACTRSRHLDRAPQFLNIRFKRRGDDGIKNETLVEFPLNNLDLSSFLPSLKSDQSSQYNLYGVIYHSGTDIDGYYYANVRKSTTTDDEDLWLHCHSGSSAAARIKQSEIINPDAYMLFYKRK